jgi:mannosyltransferase OCH1-like enzyme
MVLRSDFFRYVVVWADGGIWADVDTWAQRSFNEWISLGASPDSTPESIASLESRIGMIVGIECMKGEGGEWDSLAQYVFAAKQGHPILLELIARVIEKAGDIANRLDAVDEIMNREVLGMTGPGIFTDLIGEWIKTKWDASFNLHRDWRRMTNATVFGDILVLPVWAFGSGVGFPNTMGWDDPRICAGHRFLGSWVVEGRW